MYKASNRAGQTVEGIIEASDRKEVVNTLQSKSLFLLKLNEIYPKSSTDITIGSAKLPKRVLAVFCMQFSSILKAGVPLVQALSMLEDQTENEKLKKIIQAVGEDLQRGRGLSQALSIHERMLPGLMVKMIEAGEVSGTLDLSLDRLANHFEREHKLARKIKSAMSYPTVVCVIALLVVVFLLVFIVPRFSAFFSSVGEDLPGITKFMVGLSDFFVQRWMVLVGIVALVFVAFKTYKSSEKGRLSWDSLKFKLPLFKKTVVWVLAARLSRTLSTLTVTGISLTQSLRIASKVVGNRLAEYKLNDAEDQIKQGRTLHMAISAAGIFPRLLVQMIKIGEESGTLDQLLDKTAEYFEDEADMVISRLVTILQPILLVFVAVIVLLIILSVLLPMLSMYQSV